MARFSLLVSTALLLGACASVPAIPPAVLAEPVAEAPSKAPEPTMPPVRVEALPPPQAAPISAAATCPVPTACEGPPPVAPPPETVFALGEARPLVCAAERPAEGALEGRPNLQLMWENYIALPPEGVWAEVGGQVLVNGCLGPEEGGWTNACTVRMSHMLNRAGHAIPAMPGQTVTGAHGDNYIFRLNDMRRYLSARLGPADMDRTDGYAWAGDLPARPGLVLMTFPYSDNATGHATVWNGRDTVDRTGVGGLRLMFWELPCFTPPERMRANGYVDDGGES